MELRCVLIVEDSEADQFLTKLRIEEQWPETIILQAYDGQEALEVIQQGEYPPDLIILDINMPRMNGHEFLSVYDTLPNGEKRSVVVMLTSSCQQVDRDKAMRYDCVIDYFTKPLDAEDLNKVKTSIHEQFDTQ